MVMDMYKIFEEMKVMFLDYNQSEIMQIFNKYNLFKLDIYSIYLIYVQ